MSRDEEIVALRFAANECRHQANTWLAWARDADRKARDYERKEAALLATRQQQ